MTAIDQSPDRSSYLEEIVHWHRSVFEEGIGLICVHDLDGVIAEVSPGAAHTLEYPRGELIDRCVADLLPADFRPFFPDYLERVRRSGVDVGMMRLLSRGGEERVWTYRNALIDTPRRGQQVLLHAQDITALHRTRKELREARNRLEDRVRRRTAELVEVNRQLRREINERRHMETELRASRSRLELFHEIAIRAATCRSRREVVGFAVGRCGRVFRDADAVFLRPENGELIVRHATTDGDDEWAVGATARLKDRYVEQLMAGDVVVSDVAGLMAHPVREGDRLAGVLCIRSVVPPRSWLPDEIEIVREVVGFLSLALRRSGAFPAIAEEAA